MSDKFVVKVFFRGDWCPWCNAYLRDFNEHAHERVQQLGGRIVGITSQVGNKSKVNNNLKFDVLVDPQNIEAKKYEIFITPKENTPLRDVAGVYDNGMAQPGVVIEDDHGKVLYRWAIDPSKMNLGGATDRPLVTDIMGGLEQILAGDEVGTFATTDMEYLKERHPEQFKIAQDYMASLAK